jgi:lysophospholipase L1-like esterase
MALRFRTAAAAGALIASVLPAGTSAQSNPAKTGYYLSLGDSVAAGEGALPATRGFVYRLYERGVFAPATELDFGNIAIRAATADEVLTLQVPQALCIQPPRIGIPPSIITLVVGANDFLVHIATNGMPSNPAATIPGVAEGIAAKVEGIIRALVFGVPDLPAHCARSGLPGVTVLVSNYYRFDIPDPKTEAIFALALRSFHTSLSARVTKIRAEIVSGGKTAKVGYVDLFSTVSGMAGLLPLNRSNTATRGLAFEKHPTTKGHSAIAREFERVWRTLR